MRKVNADMPSRWLFLRIDPGKVRVVAFVLLFHRTTAPIVFDAYLSAARGDPSGLALMSLAYDFVLPRMMTWGEFFAVGYSADYEPGVDYRHLLHRPAAALGAPMSQLIWGSPAEGWPAIRMPDPYRQVQPTEVQSLLISGSVDFSTPAQFARDELLPALSNGRQVIISEQGHTADFWKFQPSTAARLLTSFYDTGSADDSLYRYLPMDFKPSLRLPNLAKALLGTAVLFGFSAVGLSIRARGRRGRNAATP